MKARYLLPIQPDMLRISPDHGPLHGFDSRLIGTEGGTSEVLLSYPAWTSWRFAFPPDTYIFGDSGGFDVLRRGLALDPGMVLLWQIENATVGPILDVPPFSENPGDLALGFTEGLARTVRNVQAAHLFYHYAREDGTPFRWLGVAHGRTPQEFDEWHSRVSEVHPFDEEGEGWAFKPHPVASPEGVARILAFVRAKGIRRIHLFGTGGQRAASVIFALGPEAGVEFITLDASSPITLSGNRREMVAKPDGLGWTVRPHEGDPQDISLPYALTWANLRTVTGVFAAMAREGRRDPDALLRAVLRPRQVEAVRATFAEAG